MPAQNKRVIAGLDRDAVTAKRWRGIDVGTTLGRGWHDLPVLPESRLRSSLEVQAHGMQVSKALG